MSRRPEKINVTHLVADKIKKPIQKYKSMGRGNQTFFETHCKMEKAQINPFKLKRRYFCKSNQWTGSETNFQIERKKITEILKNDCDKNQDML